MHEIVNDAPGGLYLVDWEGRDPRTGAMVRILQSSFINLQDVILLHFANFHATVACFLGMYISEDFLSGTPYTTQEISDRFYLVLTINFYSGQGRGRLRECNSRLGRKKTSAVLTVKG